VFEYHELTTITTGNEELDTRMGGGIPYPSLVIIEGSIGSGKTTLLAQFIFGALLAEKSVLLLLTEQTTVQFLNQTRNIMINLDKYYAGGALSIYSLPRVSNVLTKELAHTYVERIINHLPLWIQRFNIIAIDSLTPLARELSDDIIISLFLNFRRAASQGVIIFVTYHEDIFSSKVKNSITALSDVYLKLSTGEFGGRFVKLLHIVKIRGAPEVSESTIAFEVDPAFGIKIVPIAIAKV